MITKATSRDKIFHNEEQYPGPNHLLYRECGNIDMAETTPTHTTRTPTTTTTTTTTTTAPSSTAPPKVEEGRSPDEVGMLGMVTLGLSAGTVGVTFGIMTLMHVKLTQG